jgi:hypothetical protein
VADRRRAGLLVALAARRHGNAWIGTFLGITVLLAIRNWKFIIIPPVLAALRFAIAPGRSNIARSRSSTRPTRQAAIAW